MEGVEKNKIEIDPSLVPTVVKEQMEQLIICRNNVDEATKRAEAAKSSADAAKGKSAGVFKKKEVIESLQIAAVDIADANAINVEAQKTMFEYQQKLSDVMKFLFNLGVSNIALNRCVVRELELKLKDATEEEIDDLARQEIIGVVKQLKAQEDIIKKQSDLTDIVKEHDFILKEYEEHNSEQDHEISSQYKKDIEHDKRLNDKDIKDKNQDNEIALQSKKDEEHDMYISEIIKQLESLKENESKNNIKIMISLVASLVAVIFAIVNFFV